MARKRTAGLKLRGEVWHICTTLRVGKRSRQIRETTGCRETQVDEACAIRDQRVEEITQQLVRGTVAKTRERTWTEAAAAYVGDLERRGKDAGGRALQDIRMLTGAIGNPPLSHVHQRTLQPWIDSQEGVRASGTVARALSTCTAVLNYAARVLRDGHQPWLQTAVPKLIAPDWGRRRPYRLTWEEQDRLVEQLAEHLVPPALFALATGARQEEICSLRWEQHRVVEGLPEYSVWWIPPEIRKSNARKRTSEQDGRYLICNVTARTVVARQDRSNDVVFPTPHGGRMHRINQDGFRAARRRAGLNGVRG